MPARAIRLLGLLTSAVVFGSITTVLKTLVAHVSAEGLQAALGASTVHVSLFAVVTGGVVANVLLQTSHRFFPAPVVLAALTIIDPLTAAVVGITVLGEASLTPAAVAGLALSGGLACSGVLGLSRLRRSASPQHAPTAALLPEESPSQMDRRAGFSPVRPARKRR
ncbi:MULTISPECIES: hypothetical protein [Brevibacterium]|uniref:EamA-like transporter family protein n=1 Tax=Brevibacterium salitolerans TaxID=1403566 RepID=A0ABN2X003_9MICO|nr:hypothetical protein [Brevibacterium sp.]